MRATLEPVWSGAGFADQWFAEIAAPSNQVIVFDQSGHRSLFEEPERFHDVMTDIVLAQTFPRQPRRATAWTLPNTEHR